MRAGSPLPLSARHRAAARVCLPLKLFFSFGGVFVLTPAPSLDSAPESAENTQQLTQGHGQTNRGGLAHRAKDSNRDDATKEEALQGQIGTAVSGPRSLDFAERRVLSVTAFLAVSRSAGTCQRPSRSHTFPSQHAVMGCAAANWTARQRQDGRARAPSGTWPRTSPIFAATNMAA